MANEIETVESGNLSVVVLTIIAVAAIIAVGYLAFQAMQQPQPGVPNTGTDVNGSVDVNVPPVNDGGASSY